MSHLAAAGTRRHGLARSGRPLLAALAIGSVAALSACDQFDDTAVASRCVASAMKSAEPFGNDQERRETEAQLRRFCLVAARGRSASAE
ncbi:hypothetical protein [Ramlibacter sp.]|uniref:hypothetical protein n=1 Tax=Ramlibacter sp. TaxID=1917967 RepID=UPI002BCA7C62|nr:hypothetical protein [Ramlibacter sp.]HWI82201.1 hypothetical protein [Ramlibacter sp.]